MSRKLQVLTSITLVFALLAGMAAFRPRPARADVILVNTIADELDGDPGNGDCSLREAVENANNDDKGQADCAAGNGADTIILVPQIYTLTQIGVPDEDLNVSGDLDVFGDLTILGTDFSTTIIQAGDQSPADGQCTNCVDRVFHVFSGADLTLSNLTVRHGEPPKGTSSNPTGSNGGGIYNAGSLTLNTCLVTENKAGDGYDAAAGNGGHAGNGGGVFNSGALIATSSLIRGNEAGDGGDGGPGGNGVFGGWGGGIYSGGDSTVLLTNTYVNQNAAGRGGRGSDMVDTDAWNGGGGGHGGGIYCGNCSLTLLNATLSSNDAGRGGDGGDVTSGVGDGGDGGAGGDGGGAYISSSDAAATLGACTLKNNQTGLGGDQGDDPVMRPSSPDALDGKKGSGGGLYIRDNAQVAISGSTINDNEAYHGGGISNNGNAAVVVYNSTISANKADYYGGGLRGDDGGTIDLTFVTVTGNIADYDLSGAGTGGGFSSLEPFTMTNTIIAGNLDWSAADNPDCHGYLSSGDYNVLGADSASCIDSLQAHDQAGTTTTLLNPHLYPLADYGGSTHTHALASISPAYNQIPDGVNGCDSGVTKDQRGVIRFALCDAGAFELTYLVYMPLVLK